MYILHNQYFRTCTKSPRSGFFRDPNLFARSKQVRRRGVAAAAQWWRRGEAVVHQTHDASLQKEHNPAGSSNPQYCALWSRWWM